MPGVTSSSYCPVLFAQMNENRKKSAKSKLTTSITYIIPMLQRNSGCRDINMTRVKVKYDKCHLFDFRHRIVIKGTF